MSQGRLLKKTAVIIIASLTATFVILVVLGCKIGHSFIFYPTALFPVFIASYYSKKLSAIIAAGSVLLMAALLVFWGITPSVWEFAVVAIYIVLAFLSLLLIRNYMADTSTIRDEYDNIIQYIPLGHAVYTAVDGGKDFVFVHLNAVGEKLSSVKQKNVIGKRVTEVFPGIVESGLLSYFRKAYRSGKFQDVPPLYLQDKHHTGWVKNYVYRLKSGEIAAVYSDITEWMETKNELEDSRQLYRVLFENNHTVMLVIDPENGNIVDANAYAADFYGYKLERLKQMKISDINVLPKNRIQTDMELARNTSVSFFQFRHKLANGEIRDVEVYSGPVVRKGRTALFSIIHDVTSRKQAERELHEARTRYNQLAENIPDIVFMLDENLNCTYWNKACEQLTHIPASEALGQPVEAIYPFKNKDRIRDMIADIVQNPSPVDYLENLTIDNELLSYEILLIPSGPRFMFLIRDMTDKIKLTSELLEVNRYLEAIGKCNESMVYASGEKELLDDICRSLIDYGKYLQIWIAYYDPDNKNELTIISEAGKKQTRLFRTHRVTIEPENPFCYIAQVIHNKFPLRFDISESFHDKRVHCGLEVAVGAASGLCLPMVYQNDLTGIVMIYSFKENSFQEEEIRYLTDLTANIAHTIAGYRAKQQKLLAEQELFERLHYEEGLAKFSQALLSEEPDAIAKALNALLEASRAGRVTIFENFTDPEGELSMRQINEVCASGVAAVIDNPQLRHIRYRHFKRWETSLSSGNAVYGLIAEFPKIEREYLEPPGILSILALPVFIGQQWYGFIGFDDTRFERLWSDKDIRLLRTSAEIIGLYLGRKKSEQKIHEYQNQLRHLATELSISEERQRKQLATQLHDTIVQNLAISKINMGMLKSEFKDKTHVEKIDKIIALIDLSIKQSRNLMSDLSPPMLFDLGFLEAIEGLIEDLETKFGLKVKLQCEKRDLRFDQNASILLYQSIRELLMNVIKHSGQKEALLSIRNGDSRLAVSISDKGKGFDPEEIEREPGAERGFGLFSVRERLSYIEGDLIVSSTINKGTTVSISIPMKNGTMEYAEETHDH